MHCGLYETNPWTESIFTTHFNSTFFFSSNSVHFTLFLKFGECQTQNVTFCAFSRWFYSGNGLRVLCVQYIYTAGYLLTPLKVKLLAEGNNSSAPTWNQNYLEAESPFSKQLSSIALFFSRELLMHCTSHWKIDVLSAALTLTDNLMVMRPDPEPHFYCVGSLSDCIVFRCSWCI